MSATKDDNHKACALTVGNAENGWRLDKFLSLAKEIKSRNQAQRLINRGLVSVAGRAVKKNKVVKAGEKVEFFLPPPSPAPKPAADLKIKIVYQDKHLIVVDKPAGVVTHPGAGHHNDTLVNVLSAQVELAPAAGANRPGIVHRLDKDTSGLLLIAKTDFAYHKLVEQLKRREIKRRYLVLTAGSFKEDAGLIEAPIGRSRSNRRLRTVTAEGGRRAVSRFKVKKRLQSMTLLEVELETGRTHQIRVHMRFINHPVIGDPTYGETTIGRRLGLKRQFLHAYRLDFKHPADKVKFSLTSPLPQDLNQALRQAKKIS